MSLDAEGNQPLDKSVEMEEDTEYQRQLALFVRCSTEKGIELLKIGEIIAGLSHRRYFFLLIDRRFGEYKEKIRQYFESYHKRADGYRMMQDEILLVIKKS
jgi:hypothetical protein